MTAKFRSTVEAMNLEQVHNEVKSLCTRINAGGYIGVSDDNLIAELMRHSNNLGQEITMELDTSIAAYVVKPFKLPNAI